jgi:hypothetical protein
MKIFIFLILHIACWIGAISASDWFIKEKQEMGPFASEKPAGIFWFFVAGAVLTGLFLMNSF